MEKKDKEYFIDRSRSIILLEDAPAIDSDCQVITFFNKGDTPAFIQVVDGIMRRIAQNQQVSFGTDIPNIWERNKFNLTFDAMVTTKEVHVERAKYVLDPKC